MQEFELNKEIDNNFKCISESCQRKREVLFPGCGHLTYCRNCLQNIKDPSEKTICPFCKNASIPEYIEN